VLRSRACLPLPRQRTRFRLFSHAYSSKTWKWRLITVRCGRASDIAPRAANRHGSRRAVTPRRACSALSGPRRTFSLQTQWCSVRVPQAAWNSAPSSHWLPHRPAPRAARTLPRCACSSLPGLPRASLLQNSGWHAHARSDGAAKRPRVRWLPHRPLPPRAVRASPRRACSAPPGLLRVWATSLPHVASPRALAGAGRPPPRSRLLHQKLSLRSAAPTTDISLSEDSISRFLSEVPASRERHADDSGAWLTGLRRL
jgi:hypothetical protein